MDKQKQKKVTCSKRKPVKKPKTRSIVVSIGDMGQQLGVTRKLARDEYRVCIFTRAGGDLKQIAAAQKRASNRDSIRVVAELGQHNDVRILLRNRRELLIHPLTATLSDIPCEDANHAKPFLDGSKQPSLSEGRFATTPHLVRGVIGDIRRHAPAYPAAVLRTRG